MDAPTYEEAVEILKERYFALRYSAGVAAGARAQYYVNAAFEVHACIVAITPRPSPLSVEGKWYRLYHGPRTTVYGFKPGPWHYFPADAPAAMCGVRKRRGLLMSSWWSSQFDEQVIPPDGVCRACRRSVVT